MAKTPFDLRWSKHLGRAIFRLPKDGKGKMRNSSICINSYMKSYLKLPYFINKQFLDYFQVSHTMPSGFDETYVVSNNNIYGVFRNHLAARVEHRKTGRYVEIYSNQPGLHFYTGY